MHTSVYYLIGLLYYTTTLFNGLIYEKNINADIPEVVYTLDIDVSDEAIRVENGFSFDQLYGFETTSAMVEREGAVAAVNGMFYQSLGLPMGMIIHDGQPVLTNDIGTPTVIISEDGHCDIVDMTMNNTIVKDLEKKGDYIKVQETETTEGITIGGINGRVLNGEWGVFTPLYGSTTRIMRYSTNYRVVDGVVEAVDRKSSPVRLDGADYVLSYVGEDDSFAVGDRVGMVTTVQIGEDDAVVDTNDDTENGFSQDSIIKEAFQTGGWLVREGVSVAKNYEEFVGFSTAPQPRTLVGITENGHMLLVVIDGRDRQWSRGRSGKEAAQLMIDKGCVKAAYLDGGASSTMIVEGEVVNRPSGGEEREIAHSILIFAEKYISN